MIASCLFVPVRPAWKVIRLGGSHVGCQGWHLPQLNRAVGGIQALMLRSLAAAESGTAVEVGPKPTS